ncbi:MAG: hypothetical protein HKN17_04125 [Rhodothermales bacterium]|nr:hypothetical protein [Rhodothermales bacterium]
MSTVRLIARTAWIIPAALLALSVYQVDVARDLQSTIDNGRKVWADVTRYERSDRKDVTHVEFDIEVPMPDGSTLRKERMTLPYSIGHRIEQDSVEVYVQPGSGQDVVIASVGGTHTSIAWSNAAMSFIAFLIALAGVWGWNRYLRTGTGESAHDAG